MLRIILPFSTSSGLNARQANDLSHNRHESRDIVDGVDTDVRSDKPRKLSKKVSNQAKKSQAHAVAANVPFQTTYESK